METTPSSQPKDLFSTQAKLYASYRPTYPEDLYQFILGHVKEKNTALDVATGSGQVARYLARHFKQVFATDISRKQLDHAYKADNIFYSVSPAEKTSFDNDRFDLITVAQALHWFDREKFYAEIKRIIKPGGILAVWSYNFLSISPQIDPLIMHFYQHTVGPYWDDARRLVETAYQTITFPFPEITSPPFRFTTRYTLSHLEGYLNTWSATQQYIKKNNHNPVPELIRQITPHWPGKTLHVTFPITLKLLSPGSAG